MATTDKNTLKSWFQNGDYPNEQQFWSWMDSYWHKAEDIQIERILGLAALLAGKATNQDINNLNARIDAIEAGGLQPDTITYFADSSYSLNQDSLLEKIVVIPTGDITISLGTSEGLTDIMIDQFCPGNSATVISIDYYAFNANKSIHISGINIQSVFKFYKR